MWKPEEKKNNQKKKSRRKLKFDKQNPEINIFSFLGKNIQGNKVIFVHIHCENISEENASYGIIFSFVHIQAEFE